MTEVLLAANLSFFGGQLLILPITYEQLFDAKVLFEAFNHFQLGFVIFRQKNVAAKAAHEMLVKLTKGVLILRTFYKQLLRM